MGNKAKLVILNFHYFKIKPSKILFKKWQWLKPFIQLIWHETWASCNRKAHASDAHVQPGLLGTENGWMSRHMGGREVGGEVTQGEAAGTDGEENVPSSPLTALRRLQGLRTEEGITLAECPDIGESFYQENSVLITMKCSVWHKEDMSLT